MLFKAITSAVVCNSSHGQLIHHVIHGLPPNTGLGTWQQRLLKQRDGLRQGRHEGRVDGNPVTHECGHSIQSHGDQPGKIQARFLSLGQMGLAGAWNPQKSRSPLRLSCQAFGWGNGQPLAHRLTRFIDIKVPMSPRLCIRQSRFYNPPHR